VPLIKDRIFTENEIKTWDTVLSTHEETREFQVIDLFHIGLDILKITAKKIPQLDDINNILKKESGFEGIYVDGMEDGKSFYPMLAKKIFPIGNFIRNIKQLSYIPEPDMIHDLYGHIPFLINKDYAAFCQKFGEAACEFIDDDEKFHKFERFFWFTIEFGLIITDRGIRVFGAGIASSIGECDFALSSKPEIIDFDIDTIINQEFRIDQMQDKLFLLKNQHQLYSCIDELVDKINKN